MRRELEAGDVSACRKMWALAAPHLPQPRNDAEAEITMHRARTEAESVSLRARAYSHRWLSERGFPSGLPDALKPSAERLYPTAIHAVGVSVNAQAAWLKPIAAKIESAMSDAVAEVHADGRLLDGALVKARMAEARERTIKQLLG